PSRAATGAGRGSFICGQPPLLRRGLPRRRVAPDSAQPRALLHPLEIRLATPLPGRVPGAREALPFRRRLLVPRGAPPGGLRGLLRGPWPGARLLRSAPRSGRVLLLRLARRGRLAAHILRPAVRVVWPRHGGLPQRNVARGP